MNIPEEATEKAADAIYQLNLDDEYTPYLIARAALSAAAPMLMARAWEEGEQAGYENAKAEDWPSLTPESNPYKEHP